MGFRQELEQGDELFRRAMAKLDESNLHRRIRHRHAADQEGGQYFQRGKNLKWRQGLG